MTMNVAAARQPAGLLLLTVITMSWPVAMNTFLPAMPAIATALAVPYDAVLQAFSLSLLTLGIGQIVYGPLLDRYGRRPNLLGGLLIFTLGSAIAFAATGIDMLMLGRALQSFGACATIVIPRAMIRDLQRGAYAARAMARLAMVISTLMAIAPTLGGLMVTHIGWRSTFALSTATGVMLFVWSWLRAGETLPASARRSVTMALLAREYGRLLVNPVYLCYVAIMTFTSTSFYAFLAMTPRLFIEDFGLSPTGYGLCAVGMTGGILIGNSLAVRKVTGAGVDGMIRLVLPLATAGLLVMLALTPWPGIIAIMVPMFFYAIAHGAIFPPAFAGSLDVDPRVVGAAAAFGGFVNFMVVALLTAVLGQWHDATGFPLTVICLSGNVIVWFAHVMVRRLQRGADAAGA